MKLQKRDGYFIAGEEWDVTDKLPAKMVGQVMESIL